MCNCVTKAAKSALLKKKEENEAKRTLVWIFAVVGGVVAIAAIAYAVYSFIKARKEAEFDEFEFDFEDDFEDDFEEDFEEAFVKEEEKAETEDSKE